MPGSELKEPSSDITELLGKPGTLPVWLNPDKFLAEDFNEESCVADLRRYVPLATLQTELQNYLGVLKTKLVEVINEDYSDYVGLSSRLSNMDGAILRMRKPLMELKDKLNVIQEAVKSELLALNQGLKRRKEVATSRSLLELLQELAHLASKVEKLLLEVKGAEGGADLDSHSRLLERVAGEVSRLSFQANRGQDLAFVKLMEPRIMSCRNELEQHLAMALESSLKERQHAAALHCLHAYVELGDARPAEATLSRVVVGPLVQKIVTQHKKSHPRTGARGDNSLWALLESILNAVREEAGPVLSGSLSPQSGLRIFDFLGNVLLKEVQDALASSLPGIFSPGVPPAFHANFLASMRFLDELELMCQGRSALDKFRDSEAYASFLKRWNLSVYFSLLYQEIAGELEEASNMTKLVTLEAPNPQGLQLPLSCCLITCLEKCTNPELFLPQLADRFVKLSLQLLQHYLRWMSTALAARQSTSSAQAASASQYPSPGMPTTTTTTPRSITNGHADSPSPKAGEVEGSMAWMKDLPAQDLSIMFSDLEIVAKFVCSEFIPAMASQLSMLPTEVLAQMEGAFTGMASSVTSQAQALLEAMSADVVEKCVHVVKQLKGITATYRMTTKGPPTRHSHYVMGVMAPLRSFLDSDRLQRLSPAALSSLTLLVAETVSVRYQAMAEELLTTVRKTESSLKRLKKARPGEEAAGADAMSDSDKISLQLHLDVQEFGLQLTKAFPSLPPLSELVAYQNLVASVTPSSSVQHQLGGAMAYSPSPALALASAAPTPPATPPPQPMAALAGASSHLSADDVAATASSSTAASGEEHNPTSLPGLGEEGVLVAPAHLSEGTSLVEAPSQANHGLNGRQEKAEDGEDIL